jgi:hypothetical protein
MIGLETGPSLRKGAEAFPIDAAEASFLKDCRALKRMSRSGWFGEAQSVVSQID